MKFVAVTPELNCVVIVTLYEPGIIFVNVLNPGVGALLILIGSIEVGVIIVPSLVIVILLVLVAPTDVQVTGTLYLFVFGSFIIPVTVILGSALGIVNDSIRGSDLVFVELIVVNVIW